MYSSKSAGMDSLENYGPKNSFRKKNEQDEPVISPHDVRSLKGLLNMWLVTKCVRLYSEDVQNYLLFSD